MYSLASALSAHRTHQPAFKPVGKGQGIPLAVEIFIGVIVMGLGAYVLMHPGLNISPIGILGTKAGYLLLAIPAGVILSDYLIATAIKAVKNCCASKSSKQKVVNEDKEPDPADTLINEINETIEENHQFYTQSQKALKEADKILREVEKGVGKLEKELKAENKQKIQQLEDEKRLLQKEEGRCVQFMTLYRDKMTEISACQALHEATLRNKQDALQELRKKRGLNQEDQLVEKELSDCITASKQAIEDCKESIKQYKEKYSFYETQLTNRRNRMAEIDQEIALLNKKIDKNLEKDVEEVKK